MGGGMRGRGSANTDEFIREVDEAVRQDRWLRLWRQYGSYVIGAALAVVIGTAAGVGWRTWQQHQRVEEARRYVEAQQLLLDEQAAEAAGAFATLAEEADSGYGVLARLRAAQAQAEAGDRTAASEALNQLAGDGDAAPVYRSLAELLAAQQQLAAGQEPPSPAEVDALAGPDAPWRHSALELRALTQMQKGDTVAARSTLDDLLADPLTPPNLARRAAELLTFLGGPPEGNGSDEDAVTEAQ
jgi:hypothetical protein